MRIGEKSTETAITVLGAFKVAIKKTRQINVQKENEEEVLEYIDMAVNALEKQTPKKVINKEEFPSTCGPLHIPNFSGICPSCSHAVIRGVSGHKGCPYCLQALDWDK